MEVGGGKMPLADGIGSRMASDLGRKLVEALHEPFTNEERWLIADAYLTEAWKLGFSAGNYAKSRGFEMAEDSRDISVPQADGSSG